MHIDVDLKGWQFKDFQKALEHAFPNYDQLEIMLMQELGEALPAIATPDAMPTVVFKLLTWAKARGKLADLLAGALEANPKNPYLWRYALEVALTSDAPPTGRFAAKVLENVPFVGTPDASADIWRQRMTAAERCVCRVEIPTGIAVGTGFLVGPNIFLTNWHVAKILKSKNLSPQQAAVRFDYKLDANGQPAARQICAFASDWLLDQSEEKELDYALIRLAENIGDARGNLVPHPYEFLPDYPLFILQHPNGQPLTVQVGTILSTDSLHKQVNYTTNTAPGSSGSPCFTADWKLVALHHYGQKTSNIGVPLQDIVEQVKRQKPYLAAELGWTAKFANKAAPPDSVNVSIVEVHESEKGKVMEQFPQESPTDSLPENPFEYGIPVPPERFWGRKRQIADIRSRIGSKAAQSISIIGCYRSGKTSLLKRIDEETGHFCPTHYSPLIVNMDLQFPTFHTPDGLLEGIRRKIEAVSEKSPWNTNENDNTWAVKAGLERFRDSGRRLIVILDEFERIGERLDQFKGWGEHWRAMATAELFSLVIASTRPLREVYTHFGHDSPFENIFSKTILGLLEPEEWQAQVRERFAGTGRTISDTEMLLIDELSGGMPFYAQMAASLLWQHRDTATVRVEFDFQAADHFARLVKRLTPAQLQAMRWAAGTTRVDTPSLSLRQELKRYGLLRPDERPFSSAFATYVREQS
jgi:hypothetical protein